MKNILLIITFFTALTGCTSEDDVIIPVENNKTLVLGNWKVNKFTIIYSKDSKIENHGPSNDCEKQLNMTFYDSGKYINNFYEFFDNKCNYLPEFANYSIQGNRLLLDFYEADRSEFKIYKINKNELILDSNGEDIDGDGIPEIYRDFYQKTTNNSDNNIQKPELQFNFDNQTYYSVIDYSDKEYLGWSWIWKEGKMHTLASNINVTPNTKEETNMDIYISVYDSNPLVIGKKYNGNNLGFDLRLNSGSWGCNPCNGEFLVTEIKNNYASGIFSGILNGGFNGLQKKEVSNGIFKNIPVK